MSGDLTRREEWDRILADHGERAIIDYSDTLGYKNEYIDLIIKTALAEADPLRWDETILDFGAGTGLMTRWLARRAGAVIGLDYSLEGLRQARRAAPAGREGYVLYDGREFPFGDASFDRIYCRVVLRYIDDRETLARVAAEIRRTLKPGGRLILLEGLQRRPGEYIYTREDYLGLFEGEGLRCAAGYPIRKGRWPGIYLIRYGCVPRPLLRPIARAELAVRKRLPLPLLDYVHYLFVFEKL